MWWHFIGGGRSSVPSAQVFFFSIMSQVVGVCSLGVFIYLCIYILLLLFFGV